MKLIVLTTSDRVDHPGWFKLEASLKYHRYDYQHILQKFVFGHQLPIVFDWCKNYKGDCTHLLYTDCFDTVAFSGPDEVIGKADALMGPAEECWGVVPKRIRMLISGEKACFPLQDRRHEYPEAVTPWKFVNGGGWLVEIEFFKQLCFSEGLDDTINDQVFLMDAYLTYRHDIMIDTDCRIFQTIAFSDPKKEWIEVDGRFRNKGTWQFPVFFHGNGRTNMDWVYRLAAKQLVYVKGSSQNEFIPQ